MGLTYHKIPGGFVIAAYDPTIPLVAPRDIARLWYCMGGCRLVGIPRFASRVFPSLFAARLALAEALVTEQVRLEYDA